MAERTRARGQLLNACTGATVLTLWGSIWAVLGVRSLGGKGAPVLAIALALVVLSLLTAIINAIRQALRLPQDILSPEALERIARMRRAFGIVNLVQGMAIGATFMLGFKLRHAEYIPPVVALIVGLHFFALVTVLRVRFDYIVGTLLCSLALVTMFVLPVYASPGEVAPEPVFLWGVVTGLGSAVVLWAGAVSRLLNVRAALLM